MKSLSKSLLVLLIFSIIKIFQFGSNFIVGKLTNSEIGSLIFIYIFSIVAVFFILGIVVENYFSQFKKILLYFWVIAIAAIIILSIAGFGVSLIIFALFGIFFYAFLSIEKQIIVNMENILSVPRFVMAIISIAVGIIYYYISLHYSGAVYYTNYIFIVSSILSFLASYAVKKTDGNVIVTVGSKPPIFLGIFFLLGSALLYFLFRNQPDFSVQLNYFISFFYYGGLVILYINFDDYLGKVKIEK